MKYDTDERNQIGRGVFFPLKCHFGFVQPFCFVFSSLE